MLVGGHLDCAGKKQRTLFHIHLDTGLPLDDYIGLPLARIPLQMPQVLDRQLHFDGRMNHLG